MRRRIPTIVLFCVLIHPAAFAAGSCNDLAHVVLPETTIIAATSVAAGPFTPPSPNPSVQPRPRNVPAFCRVLACVMPAVNFELWMPTSSWNGKFEAVGNGGLAGAINYGAM